MIYMFYLKHVFCETICKLQNLQNLAKMCFENAKIFKRICEQRISSLPQT